jgi:hypothetical protein
VAAVTLDIEDGPGNGRTCRAHCTPPRQMPSAWAVSIISLSGGTVRT